ncbi:F-box domain-containing protein [Mycena sanguinolenta]|uniref:F-box domain-containing protein n=1 Tax=Mycena sanguinolenta TaxID=230812 RepID=A0A8H7CWF7_9AGAR|nr:F-box domain-containing protein [Mycena sanguinolenta]
MVFSIMKWSLPRVKSKRLSRISHALPLFRKLSEDPILPVELWDVVLNLLNNDGLLLTACVCRTWNEISIALYMRRHNVDGASLILQIPSFLLQPLHISCAVPQIHTLRCSFPAYGILRRMRSLREVVAKCPHLINLTVDWAYDPFRTRGGSSNSPETLNTGACVRRIPFLQYLYVDMDSVDAASLSEFQRNHLRTQVREPPS